jgi:hypothetical protein
MQRVIDNDEGEARERTANRDGDVTTKSLGNVESAVHHVECGAQYARATMLAVDNGLPPVRPSVLVPLAAIGGDE